MSEFWLGALAVTTIVLCIAAFAGLFYGLMVVQKEWQARVLLVGVPVFIVLLAYVFFIVVR